MSVQFSLNSAISDLRNNPYGAFNNNVMQDVIYQMLYKINGSNIIEQDNKSNLNNYFNFNFNTTNNSPYSVFNSKTSNASKLSVKELLIVTAMYYLSDLNIYDYKLINQLFNFGLNSSQVIQVLLLNNIYDLTTFCKMNNLSHDNTYTILTLKKLSALHKIQYNF